ncbi:sigma-54-dependent transcriptional regulator [Pyxidicoccus xibeiensis]|uniref:sigma-54-dependent transcriptional regulator n=1 Tax=Pyxidicoccus xibeiensis TaxID=2906759 RepID=UPI0020A790B7|nr:sigma-54 dependent transcriptional regulator [Pyxidicoccus xibeiensis]MCP3139715.1 sigma-54 dependent transcriptional regulator [Pyxidicoccus xibeiensis]
MAKVLLVDDEPGVLYTLQEVLAEHGDEVVTATSGTEALGRLEGVEAVVTDLVMPGMDGLQLLRALRERDSDLPVIVLTAQGSERAAVSAMKAGAHDYLSKPFDVDEVGLAVERAAEAYRLRGQRRRLEAEHALGRPIIGDSPALRRVLDAALRLAGRDVTVLVMGETGTGKELIASLLHVHSQRASGPLVRFNCAALPADLAESELFGHARGAFTGATQAHRGYFAQAHGGTLVLDEVGELPLTIQAKLLRALQDGELQPVGASRVERVDVRIVACTHRDLGAKVKAGRFREDLYYRLNVVELTVPPLRERREDIIPLAETFARRCAGRFGLEGVHLTPELLERLRERDWPGNVRELENTVTRLVALSEGGPIGAEALARPTAPPATGAEPSLSLREQVAAFERALVERTLAECGGNQSEAARRLRISRVTLIDKLKRHGLGPHA